MPLEIVEEELPAPPGPSELPEIVPEVVLPGAAEELPVVVWELPGAAEEVPAPGMVEEVPGTVAVPPGVGAFDPGSTTVIFPEAPEVLCPGALVCPGTVVLPGVLDPEVTLLPVVSDTEGEE